MQGVLLSWGVLGAAAGGGNRGLHQLGKSPRGFQSGSDCPGRLGAVAPPLGLAAHRACCGDPECWTHLSPFALLSPPAVPHFPEPLRDVVVEVGDSVSLPCPVQGSPPPRVTWARQDGQPVPSWLEPGRVSSRLEAAELLIHSKRAEGGGEHTRTWVLAQCHLQMPACCRLVPQQRAEPPCPLLLPSGSPAQELVCPSHRRKLGQAMAACEPPAPQHPRAEVGARAGL